MARRRGPLRLYGAPSEAEELPWTHVDDALRSAATYWVVARADGHPHPRPVWGLWHDERLHLSVGSPMVARQLEVDPTVTVHLDSGTDVVLIEGRVVDRGADDAIVGAYVEKYDRPYDVTEFGAFTVVAPLRALAWRASGLAGRDGFTATGRWEFGGGDRSRSDR